MAGVPFIAGLSGSLNDTGNSNNVLRIWCASNHRAVVREIKVTLPTTYGTGGAKVVTLNRNGTGGTFSADNTFTSKLGDHGETLQTVITRQKGDSESDAGTEIFRSYVAAESPLHLIADHYSKEIHIPGGEKLSVIVEDTSSVPLSILAYIEE